MRFRVPYRGRRDRSMAQLRDRLAAALGWESDRAGSTWHVYPLFGRAHESGGAPCWCAPALEWPEPGLVVFLHRAVN